MQNHAMEIIAEPEVRVNTNKKTAVSERRLT